VTGAAPAGAGARRDDRPAVRRDLRASAGRDLRADARSGARSGRGVGIGIPSVPAHPAVEAARVSALHQLDLLDTAPDARFDRIVRTVARLLDAPIALLNLVDDRRQWTKAGVGMPQGGEAHRSISFCAHVVDEAAPLAVPDTRRDDRFRDNPQVVEDGLGCYLGVPVRSPGGHVVGSLCIAGHEPRQLGDRELSILHDLAAWVEAEFRSDALGRATREERTVRERLEVITSSVGDGVVVFDARGRITDANPAALLMTGDGELVGRDVTSLLATPADRAALTRMLRRGELHAPVESELRLEPRGGLPYPVAVTVASMHDGGGFVATARDVSEQHRHLRELEQLQRQHRRILDVAGDAIIGIDTRGVVEYANPAAARLFGVPDGDLVGIDLHASFHHTSPDGRAVRWERCRTHHVLATGTAHTDAEEVYLRSDGTFVAVEYAATPQRVDGRVTGAVMVMRDVTTRRELDRLKADFVSAVSHELRTPLTSIKGTLSLACGGVLGDLPDDVASMLAIAQTSTDRLIRLVNDLLDLTRLDAGAADLRPAPTRLATVVGDALDAVRPCADGARVELVADVTDVTLTLDGDRIVQALTNLLANAVRYSPSGERVHVLAEVTDTSVTLSVREGGRGVPVEARERIFERFGQADASDSRERDGTGLGLPIARELVEQHGGRLWLGESETGAVFHLELPRVQRPSVPDRGSAGGPDPTRSTGPDPTCSTGLAPTCSTELDPSRSTRERTAP
jgi:PAS domain S-box-containing protein